MERKLKKSESDKRRYNKVQAAGGQDAWAMHREQRAQAAEEARPKQTAEEAELEAKQMERKCKQSESNKRRYDKVKAAGGRDAYREQRAQHKAEDLAFSLSRPKQTAEEAAAEEAAAEAKIERKHQLAQHKAEDLSFSHSRPKQTAEEAELEERGLMAAMMGECIESMKGGSRNVRWFDRKNGKHLDGKLFFIDIEGTFTAPPWSVSIVAEGIERTWIMNPLPRGSQATVQECRARLGDPWVFLRAYEAMVGILPAGADYSCSAAMKALHAAAIQRPTIVSVPFYFINLLPTSLLYISILLVN